MSVRGATSPGEPKFQKEAQEYDAVLVMSFGGPEGPDEVMPFLENVLKGRSVPRERMIEVSHHYEKFGGVSPINRQNRELIQALERELKAHDIRLPVYFGNRNWHPMITDTVRQMKEDGVRRAVAFFTSGFSCYSGCRQYREDIMRAQDEVGEGAPEIDKLRVFYNHPGFVDPSAANLRAALSELPDDRRTGARVLFTAHSIPISMAEASDYEKQLAESARLVAEGADTETYELVYQSRSGPPHIPWLEPDVVDRMEELAADGVEDFVVHPIGFISDHMEVIYDLDTEARGRADALGVNLIRVPTVGTAPAFIGMIRELIEERMTDHPERRTVGRYGPSHDVCPVECCLAGEG